MAQALVDAAQTQTAISVLNCATWVAGAGPLTRHFDWVVAQHCRTVVLSGRLTAVVPLSPTPPLPVSPKLNLNLNLNLPDDDSEAQQSASMNLEMEERDFGDCCGAATLPESSAAEASPRRCATPDVDTALDEHGCYFAQSDVARKVQEARQFAELKAYGELLRQKDAFVDRIFHEIRTPCHTLQMITQSLVEQLPSDSDLKCQLQLAWAQGVHICQLADDVKRAMLLQAGQPPPLQRVWVPLSSVIHASQGFIERLFPKGDITLQVCCDSVSPEVLVFVDIGILSTVLCHLLTNAMKFTDDGQVALNLQGDGDGRVTFSVRNHGPQLPEETIRQLGDKYWQLSNPAARTDLEESLTECGLGLHISFHYVRLMGGQLQVQSTSTATTFWFSIETDVGQRRGSTGSDSMPSCASQPSLGMLRASAGIVASTSTLWATWLNQPNSVEAGSSPATSVASNTFLDPQSHASSLVPRRASDHQHSFSEGRKNQKQAKRKGIWDCLMPWARKKGAAASPEGKKVATPFPVPSKRSVKSLDKRPHVLVVEDNVVCQKVVCRCLDQAGITYAVASNGKVACEMVEADLDAFDVVLMDLRMPVMDGIAATQHLRQKLCCTSPIVVFSAEVGEATLEQVARAGATDLLQKPAMPRMVLDMIYKHCPSHLR
eukprot:GGOE01008113.1.p1 GENE.GGOE01008113.1~~GGOE01008113.1.p1  ORF type:complete len:767 (-),score=204.26 GGOE01008113.1:2174-4153(-)